MIAAILLSMALIVLLLWVKRNKIQDIQIDKDAPVFSKSLPIIGVTHIVLHFGKNFLQSIKSISEACSQQGGVVKSRIALITHYMITDPDDAVTVANECLDRHFVYKFVESYFGQSLLGLPVKEWKHHRKLLNPAFTLPMIHGFIDCFNSQAKALLEELRPFVGRGPFKATQYIHDNIMRGTCLTTVGNNHINDKDTIEQYSEALNEISTICANRFQNVWQHSDLIYKLSGQKKIQDKVIEKITTLTDKIIQKAKMAMINGANNNLSTRQVGTTTFLDKYLEINANNALTDREFREELYFIIAAAFETTAYTFEFLLNFLGTYPEIQERVLKEVLSVIGQERCIEKEDLQKLVYTEAVIKETLRLYPGVPVVGRSIKQDVKLKNCTLRGGTYAILLLYGINRHPSWGPDVEQFRPERWLEPGGVPNVASSFATFSLGKRNCIGKIYALTELKIYLAHFIRKYHIEADYTKMQLKWDIILKTVNGHEISLKLRDI